MRATSHRVTMRWCGPFGRGVVKVCSKAKKGLGQAASLLPLIDMGDFAILCPTASKVPVPRLGALNTPCTTRATLRGRQINARTRNVGPSSHIVRKLIMTSSRFPNPSQEQGRGRRKKTIRRLGSYDGNRGVACTFRSDTKESRNQRRETRRVLSKAKRQQRRRHGTNPPYGSLSPPSSRL